VKLPIQLDRYTLVEPIGAGAFGRVYRAEVRGDMGFVSDFAVKVLDSNVVQTNPNVAAQMADEARLLSQLDHPNIVKVIDFKHVDHFVLGDVYMMVLEFVRGVDVAEILEVLQARRGSIPATAVLHLALMVADALNHANSMTTRDGNALRLVHRDLKPHNLMVNFRGQVKILDFGIAKAKSARMAAATQEGQTKGTVFYMSPEQLAGEELDGRSDLYSLGTIVFELLFGRRLLDVEVHTPADLARAMHTAFEMDIEERLQALRAHLLTGANGPHTEDAVEGWLALLRSVLQKDARYRPDNARVFAEQLEWLRSKLDSESVDREFWVRIVEEVAAARAARGGPRIPPLAAPPPRRAQPLDELPLADISMSESAQDFFGMESGAMDDEAPVRMPASEVPMTRAMSSVRGTVRSFGSEQVQQISPLTEVMRQVRSEEAESRRVEESTDSLIVPGLKRPTADAVEAPTVAVDAVPKGKVKSKSLQEADTYVPPAKRAADKDAKAGRAARPGKPTDRRLLGVLAAVALVLIVMIGVLLTRGGDSSDATPADEADGAAVAATVDPPPVESATPEVQTPEATPEAGADEPDEDEPGEDEPGEDEPEAAEQDDPPVAPPAEPERVAEAPAEREPVPRPEPRVEASPTPRADPKPAPAPRPEPADAVASGDVEPGILHISARPRCQIEVNGEPRGTSDETRLGIVLPPGEYTVRFVCDESEPECAQFSRRTGRKSIEVRSGEKSRYHADFYKLNEKYQ
jgi:serine/threonine protein kinase